MLSQSNETILTELNSLQNRVDELRSMLRQATMNETLPDGEFNILVCRTGQDFLGILLRDVEEVLPVCRLTQVPDAAYWFSGLLNIGGEMVPVVDFAARISGNKLQLALSDSIVVCTINETRMGLLINDVEGIHTLERTEIHAVSNRLVAAPYLLGVSEIEKRTVLLLNLLSLLAHSQNNREAS